MVEIKESNEKFGVFDACALKEVEAREKMKNFLQENNFIVFLLHKDCKEIKEHEVIREMERKAWKEYEGIVIINNDRGMEIYKDMFHRSSTYVHDKIISHKCFLKIFENQTQVFSFFEDMLKNNKNTQIRGIKQVLLRKKMVS